MAWGAFLGMRHLAAVGSALDQLESLSLDWRRRSSQQGDKGGLRRRGALVRSSGEGLARLHSPNT
jgi:hypothetical protein